MCLHEDAEGGETIRRVVLKRAGGCGDEEHDEAVRGRDAEKSLAAVREALLLRQVAMLL